MIESWIFAIGIAVAWINGAVIGFLYRVRQERRSGYRVAKDRFEERRESVIGHLRKRND